MLPGERIALFTNNDSAYRAAACAEEGGRRDRGHRRRARRDLRPPCASSPARPAAEILAGHAVVDTEGGKALSGIKVQRFDAASGALSGDARSIHADCLLMSGGWSPTIHLASQAGAQGRMERRPASLPAAEADAELDRRRRLHRQLLDRRGDRRRPRRRPCGRRRARARRRRSARCRGGGARPRSGAGLRDQGQGQEPSSTSSTT